MARREHTQDQASRNGVAGRRTVVHDDDVRVREVTADVGVREARDRFGGFDLPATLAGMLTALSLVVLIGGLVGAAIGAVGYQTGLDGAEELSLAALAGGLLTLFLAFVGGGWTAARIARYDGVRNGLMTAVWAVVLAALLSALAATLGDAYDVFRNVDLPQPFSREAITTGAIVSGAAAVAAMLLGGALGGVRGQRFHRQADAAIVRTRQGGIAARAGTEREVEVER
jgi:hypothetical protein